MSRDGHWAHQYTHTQYKCEYFTPMIEPPESVQIFLHVNTDFWSDVHALRAFEATGNLLVKPFFMSVSRPKEDKEKNAFSSKRKFWREIARLIINKRRSTLE